MNSYQNSPSYDWLNAITSMMATVMAMAFMARMVRRVLALDEPSIRPMTQELLPQTEEQRRLSAGRRPSTIRAIADQMGIEHRRVLVLLRRAGLVLDTRDPARTIKLLKRQMYSIWALMAVWAISRSSIRIPRRPDCHSSPERAQSVDVLIGTGYPSIRPEVHW